MPISTNIITSFSYRKRRCFHDCIQLNSLNEYDDHDSILFTNIFKFLCFKHSIKAGRSTLLNWDVNIVWFIWSVAHKHTLIYLSLSKADEFHLKLLMIDNYKLLI